PRRTVRWCVTALLGGSLTLTTTSAPAAAEEAVAVPIENPRLDRPVVPSGAQPQAPARWTAQQTQLFSAKLASHPERLQAASLNRAGPGTLTTRLWRVQKGAEVTLTWDDSPSPLHECTPGEVTGGQLYAVIVAGDDGDVSTPFTTKGTVRGTVNWQTTVTHTFTAAENNPKVTFASKQPDKASKCGPLLTRFAATQNPAPVPYGNKKPRLPTPEAYKGHAVIFPRIVAADCNRSPAACRFEQDDRYSFRYYDRPRMVGQAYINCTRNSITDERVVTWEELPYDNITQYFVDKEHKPLTPQRALLKESYVHVATQIESGFTRADGNPLEMATTNPLRWNRTEDRKLSVSVQPGEVSWIEVQPARERITGTLVSTTENERLDITVDVPSGSLADRFYQRTGPLSKVEQTRCGDARDNARTPDNTIGAPTLRAFGPVGAQPAGMTTRSRPVRAPATRAGRD
ncbi:hypothetical protein, partial [Streptomyces clavuligerus]|uniref:hypothetical protein n=1 Tax=Streptomyces clavuligerus TaxID=1901 RepID=UPI0018D05DC6